MSKKNQPSKPKQPRLRSTPIDAAPTPAPVNPSVFLAALEIHRGDTLKTCKELGLHESQCRAMFLSDAKFAEDCHGVSRSFDINSQMRFLQELMNTRDLFSACRVSGIPRELAYKRRHDDPPFRDEWIRIEDIWERRLAERGTPEETYLDKEIIEGTYTIRMRIRDSDQGDKAIFAFTNLYGTSEEWIPRGHLQPRFGIPPTSVEEDFLEWNPPRAKRGGHGEGGGVAYARSYLLTFVIYRWEPKGPARKRRT